MDTDALFEQADAAVVAIINEIESADAPGDVRRTPAERVVAELEQVRLALDAIRRRHFSGPPERDRDV